VIYAENGYLERIGRRKGLDKYLLAWYYLDFLPMAKAVASPTTVVPPITDAAVG